VGSAPGAPNKSGPCFAADGRGLNIVAGSEANKTRVKLCGGRERPLTLGDIMVYALSASGTRMQVQTGRKRLRQIIEQTRSF
jgi:hypothetical protein